MDELEDLSSGFGFLSDEGCMESTQEPSDEEPQGNRHWNSDSCGAFLEGPSEPVNISASSLSRFAGRDFEVEFQTQLEEKCTKEDDERLLDLREDSNGRFLWDQYRVGLWAPYPEFYLPDDSTNEEDSSVFERLKATMTLITDVVLPNYFVYKRTVQGGSGIPVGNKQIVLLHYTAYVEYADEPVDVAYSRAMKRSFKFQVDRGNALPGFEMAIKSMSQGDAAIFIVSSSLAYGKFGCPPRYPGGADIFYFIELISVSPNDPLELAMQLPAEEREHLDFTAVRKVLIKCFNRVDFFFKQAEFRRAQSYQRWAIDLLEHCRTADEVEDKARVKLLRSAFSNGAVIAHKMRLPKSVMYHTGNVLKMEKNDRKALYLRILALLELKERSEALTLCRRGVAVHRDSDHFSRLLTKVRDEESLERKRERELYARMMGRTHIEVSSKQQPALGTQQLLTDDVKSNNFTEKSPTETAAKDFERIVSDFKNKSDAREIILNITGFSIQDVQNLDRAAGIFAVETEYARDLSVTLRKLQ